MTCDCNDEYRKASRASWENPMLGTLGGSTSATSPRFICCKIDFWALLQTVNQDLHLYIVLIPFRDFQRYRICRMETLHLGSCYCTVMKFRLSHRASSLPVDVMSQAINPKSDPKSTTQSSCYLLPTCHFDPF